MRRSVSVACPLEQAFEAWTQRMHLWWPVKRLSVSLDPSTRVVLEGKLGGRLYERTAAGTEHDWGRVVRWEPPTLLGYEWFLGSDPRSATEVVVRFVEEGDGTTTVHVEHGKWHLADPQVAEAQRACVAAQEGWSGVLQDFEQLIGQH